MTPVQEAKIEKKLLKISGVLVSSEDSRVYPYGKKASHLTGYVQEISAEELEKRKIRDMSRDSWWGKAVLKYYMKTGSMRPTDIRYRFSMRTAEKRRCLP